MAVRILLMEVPWYVFFPKANQPDAPLGASYVAAALEGRHDVRIYNPDLKGGVDLAINDFKNEMDDYKVYLETVKAGSHPIWSSIRRIVEDFSPRMVGLTVRTPAIDLAVKTARLIKSIDDSIITVLGGPHPTCRPMEVIGHDSVDVVVVGEGEATMAELADRVERGESLEGLRGTVAKAGGRVLRNAPRPLIEDLDSIPFPAKYLIMNTEHMQSDNFANVFSTRGCPYSCTFCSSYNVWTRGVRYRSPENVVAEMKFMEDRYGSEFFSFSDDSFTVNKKWVIRLCELIGRERFKGYFRWVCNTKSNLVDEDVVKALKEAGCVAVALGIESGNDDTLKRMKKGSTTEQGRRAVELLRKYNLKFSGQFVIGFPWETEVEIMDTINFMKELDPVSVMMSIATPLPGTELFEEAANMGIIDRHNTDWSMVTTKNDGILFNPAIPKERVAELVALARRESELQEKKWEKVKYDYKELRKKSAPAVPASHGDVTP